MILQLACHETLILYKAPTDPVSVDAMTGSYRSLVIHSAPRRPGSDWHGAGGGNDWELSRLTVWLSIQSWSHRHGVGGDLSEILRSSSSIQSWSHRRRVGGDRMQVPASYMACRLFGGVAALNPRPISVIPPGSAKLQRSGNSDFGFTRRAGGVSPRIASRRTLESRLYVGNCRAATNIRLRPRTPPPSCPSLPHTDRIGSSVLSIVAMK
jgi:hypothetical protein